MSEDCMAISSLRNMPYAEIVAFYELSTWKIINFY